MLVETFGGKRNYHFYVSPEADVSAALARLKATYPAEPLTCKTRKDAGWGLLEGYAKKLF